MNFGATGRYQLEGWERWRARQIQQTRTGRRMEHAEGPYVVRGVRSLLYWGRGVPETP